MENLFICNETSSFKNKSILSSFIIEPLPSSTAISLGNALRRTLLTNIPGFAITSCHINYLQHEFNIIEGVREEPFELLLNLKEIIFQPLLLEPLTNLPLTLKAKAFLKLRGPIIVTAGMLQLPKNLVKILNPEQYICTILKPTNFYLMVNIEYGTGYKLQEEQVIKVPKKKETTVLDYNLNQSFPLFLDTCFMPVKQVTFKIKLINDDLGFLKESLYLEILTDGSISPKRSLYEAFYFLIDLIFKTLHNIIPISNI